VPAWQTHENGFVESFIGRLCDECLNEHLFSSYDHARKFINAWRNDYNITRPHSRLEGFSPIQYATPVHNKPQDEQAGRLWPPDGVAFRLE